MSAARYTDFMRLKKDFEALEKDFDNRVNARVQAIFREMADTMKHWPYLTISEHFANAARKLELGID